MRKIAKGGIKESYKEVVEPLRPLVEVFAERVGAEDMVEAMTGEASVLPLGLPFRLPKHVWEDLYPQLSREELKVLKRIGQLDYAVEWRFSQGKNLGIVAEAAERAGLGDANRRMNLALAVNALQAVPLGSGDTLRILDVGAGTGDTTASLLTHLSLRMPGEGVEVFLTDLSRASDPEGVRERAFEIAEGEGFPSHAVAAFLEEVKLHTTVMDFTNPFSLGAFMTNFTDKVDVVVANASLHHTNSAEGALRHLMKLSPSLIAVGEWTHVLHESLASVEATLSLLRRAVEGSGVEVTFKGAEGKIMAFWKEVAALARERGEVSPIWYFEGHRSARGWLSVLRRFGDVVRRVELNDGLNTIFFLRVGGEVKPLPGSCEGLRRT